MLCAQPLDNQWTFATTVIVCQKDGKKIIQSSATNISWLKDSFCPIFSLVFVTQRNICTLILQDEPFFRESEKLET